MATSLKFFPKLRSIRDFDFTGRSVFIRLDLNVPIKKGVLQDDTRIQKSLDTIRKVHETAKRVCIASHLGRPKNGPDANLSLIPVGTRLSELTGLEIVHVADYIEEPIDQIFPHLTSNQIILLENLRFHPEETEGSSEFARKIMNGFDTYVNDAFGCCHRAHSSIEHAAMEVPEERRLAGLLVEEEVKQLSYLTGNPQGPFAVVIGGSKVSDKIGVILNLIEKCNDLLIGGAMAYTFLKFQGVETGKSVVENDKMDLVEKIFINAKKRKVNIHLPVDHVCGGEFAESTTVTTTHSSAIPAGLMGLDIGPKTLRNYSEIISSARTVLWNGPVGVFEWSAFKAGSLGIAEAMAKSRAKTFVGGGDSISALNHAGVADKITHVSTGGGASLEFLEGRVLPGLRVLYEQFGRGD